MNRDVDYYMNLHYVIEVVEDETTDGEPCYLATHPDLPGCMSHGATLDEALRNLADARQAYIQSLLEDGVPVPEPTMVVTTTATGGAAVGQALWIAGAAAEDRQRPLPQPSTGQSFEFVTT
jgi:predicted RNase H-like HicB family nuclease